MRRWKRLKIKTKQRLHRRRLNLETVFRGSYCVAMSTAEKIFRKAQALPEPTQAALLEIVEALSTTHESSDAKPQFGSAKGKIVLASDFDEPLDDFKPYIE